MPSSHHKYNETLNVSPFAFSRLEGAGIQGYGLRVEMLRQEMLKQRIIFQIIYIAEIECELPFTLMTG